MKGYWDNLRPLEKRMVVGVAAMFFLILNAWFVWPHFSDWGRVQLRMDKARKLLNMYQAEINQMQTYETNIRKLQGQENQAIALEDQAGHFAEEIRSLASGVTIVSFPPIRARTFRRSGLADGSSLHGLNVEAVAVEIFIAFSVRPGLHASMTVLDVSERFQPSLRAPRPESRAVGSHQRGGLPEWIAGRKARELAVR